MRSPYGISIFCDDIRHEISGKRTFVGVYGSKLIVLAEVPVHLPKLAISTRIMVPSNLSAKEQVFRVIKVTTADQAEEIIYEHAQELQLSGDGEKYLIETVEVSFAPFSVDQDFDLKVRAYFDGIETKLGILQVRSMPNSGIETPPSSPDNSLNAE